MGFSEYEVVANSCQLSATGFVLGLCRTACDPPKVADQVRLLAGTLYPCGVTDSSRPCEGRGPGSIPGEDTNQRRGSQTARPPPAKRLKWVRLPPASLIHGLGSNQPVPGAGRRLRRFLPGPVRWFFGSACFDHSGEFGRADRQIHPLKAAASVARRIS
jgi:hypothetical protein